MHGADTTQKKTKQNIHEKENEKIVNHGIKTTKSNK
jgi:hypothetical protein